MDVTVPNAARVYDYVLGGTHHFEADRQAAQIMVSLLPSTPKWVRRLRRFLHCASRQLGDQGLHHFLDLGSGLPTEAHIHSTVPEAQVVYVDIDPAVVSYGRALLGSNSRAEYLQADIRDIDEILSSSTVRKVLSGAPRVAIGLNAISCFLTVDEIQRLMHTLYDWAPLGSRLFTTFETKAEGAMTSRLQQFLDMFSQMGSPYHFLTLEQAKTLLAPWQPDANGLRPLSDWLGDTEQVEPDDDEGVGLEFYGAIAGKD